MKVYVVEEISGFGNVEVLGVFSSFKRAKDFSYAANINERITEHIIDEEPYDL